MLLRQGTVLKKRARRQNVRSPSVPIVRGVPGEKETTDVPITSIVPSGESGSLMNGKTYARQRGG